MQRVFVVDPHRQPLTPCRPARARILLTQNRAVIYKRYPFTILLRQAPTALRTPTLRLKIDPGSRVTGLALVNDANSSVLWAAELHHRGQLVHQRLLQRAQVRRSRRHRHTRYREPRFANRRRTDHWLPPSLDSRIQNICTWLHRLRRISPLAALSCETARFDTQLLQDPTITSLDYQHGTLAGFEIKQYLLLKWHYRCAYCHQPATRWEADHIVPRSRGGSDRPSNLALACPTCNLKKGNRTAANTDTPPFRAKHGCHSKTQPRSTLPDGHSTTVSRRPRSPSRQEQVAAPTSTAASNTSARHTGSTLHVSVPAHPHIYAVTMLFR